MPTDQVTADNLNQAMEFDHVIQVHADGAVTDAPDTVHAPELYDDELHHHTFGPLTWTLMNGYSGQHGYSGPMMHQSEFIGGGLARDILAAPGYYVALVNRTSDDAEPTEWAVARADIPEPVSHRWDVQIDVHGGADIRASLRAAAANLTGCLRGHGVRADITAFDGDGDAIDAWSTTDEPTTTATASRPPRSPGV